MVAGVSLSERHERMMLRYRRQPPNRARAQLIAEIRHAVASEAFARAADLLIVLRVTLAHVGDARMTLRRRRLPVRLGRARWMPNIDYFAQDVLERENREGVIAPFSGAGLRGV
jgi:hypothetical protein